MRGFVPEMPEQRAIGFAKRGAAPFAFHIVRFRERHRDEPERVSRHDGWTHRGS